MNFKFTYSIKKKINRVIILGSSGIISTNLQRLLKSKNIDTLVIGSSKINLKKNTFKLLRKKIKKNDIIIFIAAEAPVKNTEMLFNNLQMCRTVCKSLENKKIKQLIYISSDAVYGDDKKKITEKSNILPGSLHGLMHSTREKILKDKFNKILCILRPTLIYGIGDTHNGYGPNRFVNLALKNKKISIFGNGEEKRDHIFIEDLVNIIFKCIEKEALGVLNLASGKVYSFKKIAQEVINLTNSDSKIKKIKRNGPMPHNGYRPFNTNLLKKYFKEIKLSSLNVGIKKYLKSISI